jgi:hypothetical protein
MDAGEVFRGGSSFEGKEGSQERFGQRRVGGKGVGEAGSVGIVIGVGRGKLGSSGQEVRAKGGHEAGQTPGIDSGKDARVREVKKHTHRDNRFCSFIARVLHPKHRFRVSR